jgi:transglutaminase-like putative cysteine protease
MLLRLFHRTTFVYGGIARESFNEVRLCPPNSRDQKLRRFDLRTEPQSSLLPYIDYFGNSAHRFSVAAPHTELVVAAESEIETQPDAERDPVPDARLDAPETADEFDPQSEFLQPSKYVPLDEDLMRATAQALPEPEMIWASVRTLARHVFRSLVYRPQATGVDTLASEALRLRAGVCQDFAHVTLGLCRCAGIPARYVSGYFFNTQRVEGQTEASHAWIEAYVPGYGWASWDPTHDRPADERYIHVAVGRDYGDIRPVSGTYRGSPTREMRVDVEVRDLSATAATPG